MAKHSWGLIISPDKLGNEADSNVKKKKGNKSEELLSITALDSYGKCKKKCKGESIQCDLCGLWAHASCERITRDQYRAITAFSTKDYVVYYCHTNDCSSRIKFITNEWVKFTNQTQWHLTNECHSSKGYH